MDNNNNNKLELPDPDNIYGCKRFRKRYGNEIYLDLVNQKKLLNMHPCQRRIRPKKQIIFIADDDHLNNNQHESILFGDEQQIINDGLLAEDNKNNNDTMVVDDVVMEEENFVFDCDDDNCLSNNDDIDDDDWHNINEEEEDEIIYQMHGGGNCFEDGTTDDFDDEQEVDIVRSYYSNSFNLLEDYCLMIADIIKRRADEIFQQDDLQQNLYPDSSVTVKDCSLMIRNYTSKHKVTNQGELSLVLLLKKLLPSNANLPFHKTKYGSYVSDVDKILNQENLIRGMKDFDICPLNGCTVFVGDDEFKFQCLL